MAEQLIRHLQTIVEVNEPDIPVLLSFFRRVEVSKKENLLVAGQLCRSNYFVLKGCLRLFFLNEKGVEQTTQFALENWWLSDYMAYMQQRPTECFIQAVEKTELLVIDYQAQEELLARFPYLERYFRWMYQRAYAAAQVRIRYLYEFSREELYRHFSEHFPEFTQRIPQYLLASFLGFTPEYLSEIRRKRS